MCSTDFGIMDFLIEKEDPKGAGLSLNLDAFKNTVFSNSEDFASLETPDLDVKNQDLDMDWKMASEWDAEELFREFVGSSEDVITSSCPTVMQGPTLASCPTTLGTAPMAMPSLGSLNTPNAMDVPDDVDDLKNLVGLGLPFDVVLDSGASDSGMSSDSSLEPQMSPLSGYSVPSPNSFVDMGNFAGFSSPDSGIDAGTDTISEVSSVSDLGSSSPHSTISSSNNFILPQSPATSVFGGDEFIQTTDSGFSSPISHPVPDFITTNIKNIINSNTVNNTNTVTSTVNNNTTTATANINNFINSSNNSKNTTTNINNINSVLSPIASPTPAIVNIVSTQQNTVPTTIVTRPVTTTAVNNSNHKITTPSTTPILKKVTVAATSSSTSPTVSNTNSGQTIVVTQASKGGPTAQLVRAGTILKTSQQNRSILLPVTFQTNNNGQIRTIKIISSNNNNVNANDGRGVRTVVSTVRPQSQNGAASTTTLNNRTTLLTNVRNHDTKSLLKGGTTTVVTSARGGTTTLSPRVPSLNTSPTRIKSECDDDDDFDDDDDDDDEQRNNNFQQLTLSDEEKRLLKKEGIHLPTHYPLTKHEERELKRIRRKIRNKISAQDSRKRKKEYIDGLEDRVKACTEENQQLQKRIRTLEEQNASLLAQMKRFQSSMIGGHNGRSQAHASTALMMLILSAALFVVPSLHQDGSSSDSELSLPVSKMPSAGHSRSLLEAGNNGLVTKVLESLESIDEEMAADPELPLVQALNDHDYTPPPKRQRTISKVAEYYIPPLDDYPPQIGKTDSGGGFPPDDGSGTKLANRIMEMVGDSSPTNYSDPGGKEQQQNHSHSVVVNLGQNRKRLRDDLELE